MKRSKKQFEQRDPAASGENKQQRGYLFAGLMILAGIVVALVSAAVHRATQSLRMRIRNFWIRYHI